MKIRLAKKILKAYRDEYSVAMRLIYSKLFPLSPQITGCKYNTKDVSRAINRMMRHLNRRGHK